MLLIYDFCSCAKTGKTDKAMSISHREIMCYWKYIIAINVYFQQWPFLRLNCKYEKTIYLQHDLHGVAANNEHIEEETFTAYFYMAWLRPSIIVLDNLVLLSKKRHGDTGEAFFALLYVVIKPIGRHRVIIAFLAKYTERAPKCMVAFILENAADDFRDVVIEPITTLVCRGDDGIPDAHVSMPNSSDVHVKSNLHFNHELLTSTAVDIWDRRAPDYTPNTPIDTLCSAHGTLYVDTKNYRWSDQLKAIFLSYQR